LEQGRGGKEGRREGEKEGRGEEEGRREGGKKYLFLIEQP
jgi:hypothetical protein